jgi:hypothetical protein
MEDARAAAKNDGRWLFQRAARESAAKRRFWRSAMHTSTRCLTDPIRLPGQMHVYVGNSDPEIREGVRIGYGDLIAYAEQVSGLSPERISSFLATGMLLSVLALMQVQDGAEHWAETLLEGCMRTCRASAPDPLLMGAICGRSLPEDARRWPVRRWHVSEPV